MSRICFVADSKSQLAIPALAENLYTSGLFKRAKQYAIVNAQRWFILSARHGLLTPDTLIAPYSETIDTLSDNERFHIVQQIMTAFTRYRMSKHDQLTILAKATYRELLHPVLKGRGIQASFPLEGKGVVQQMRWLEAAVE